MTTLQRRYYMIIAEIINGLPTMYREIVALWFSRELAENNSRFDREKFWKACTKGGNW